MTLRDEALLMLEKRGAILGIAREVSRLMKEAGLSGVVVGGVAVVLHGHVRTTNDVDILIDPPHSKLRDLLVANGYVHNQARKEFVKDSVPVHLVRPEDAGAVVRGDPCVIEGVTTIGLTDLIAMRLRSGTADPLRAQDLADVVGLIRHHKLTGELARDLDEPLRRPYRRLVRLIEREA